MTRLLLATRSEHKAREIRRILAPAFRGRIVTPAELGLAASAEEEEIEAFETFRENALAKARWFLDRTGLPTVADDSGLEVDAMGGAPGVRSRRFSGRPDLEGAALDRENNAALLRRLAGVPAERRGGRYVCAATLLGTDGTQVTAVGTVRGVLLEEPRGAGGFGYDPLFLVPELGCTFAEASADAKDTLSHRGRAFRGLAGVLRA